MTVVLDEVKVRGTPAMKKRKLLQKRSSCFSKQQLMKKKGKLENAAKIAGEIFKIDHALREIQQENESHYTALVKSLQNPADPLRARKRQRC